MHFVFDQHVKVSGRLPVPFDILAASEAYQECWMTDEPMVFSREPQFEQWQNAEFLVLSMESLAADIGQLSADVYSAALAQATTLGYLTLIRTWNYFPQINEESGGLERYQSFCVSRQKVLNQFPVFEKQNPAATAIGTHNKQNHFVFLFAKTAGIGIENKRQLSAWEYPKKYAPKQPRFARAMLHSGVLMCSGTASVVGHETKHVGDLEKQFHESLLNVKTLLKETGDQFEMSAGYFRFYLRDAKDLALLNQLIEQSALSHYVVLLADVCRADLLIECEAVFQK